MRGIGLTEDRSVSRNRALFHVRGGDFVYFRMGVEVLVSAAVFVF